MSVCYIYWNDNIKISRVFNVFHLHLSWVKYIQVFCVPMSFVTRVNNKCPFSTGSIVRECLWKYIKRKGKFKFRCQNIHLWQVCKRTNIFFKLDQRVKCKQMNESWIEAYYCNCDIIMDIFQFSNVCALQKHAKCH